MDYNNQSLSRDEPSADAAGSSIYALVERLFPICRSITGDGVRETLRILQSLISLDVHEVPSGTPAFDWQVPLEWNIHDAWIADENGERVVDFRSSNLHIVSGSTPINRRMAWSDLKSKLTTLPDHPEWIPYRTSFHAEDWGFCLSQTQFDKLEACGQACEYDVVIDSTLSGGSLTYGELLIPGESTDEVLISAHICHPSLANDGLSGVSVAAHLARRMAGKSNRYSYRFLFAPATIGAITWLAVNEHRLDRIRHGFLMPVVGDRGSLSWRKSRRGDADIDRAAAHVLRHRGAHQVLEFEPFGYDQRQYCSPGIDLPMGCLMRTPNGQYPEYHSSADDLDLICPDALADTLSAAESIIDVIDQNGTFRNLNPMCEPRLGPRGLYHAFGREQDRQQLQQAVLWTLNLSDGSHSLLDIAERANMPFAVIRAAADALSECELLAPTDVVTPVRHGSMTDALDSGHDDITQQSALSEA